MDYFYSDAVAPFYSALDRNVTATAAWLSRGVNTTCKGVDLVGYQLNDNQPADPYLTYMEKAWLLETHLDDLTKRIATKHIYEALYPTPFQNGLRTPATWRWFAVKGHLDRLQESGRIRMTGHQPPRRWEST
jgi:hypothetical protein